MCYDPFAIDFICPGCQPLLLLGLHSVTGSLKPWWVMRGNTRNRPEFQGQEEKMSLAPSITIQNLFLIKACSMTFLLSTQWVLRQSRRTLTRRASHLWAPRPGMKPETASAPTTCQKPLHCRLYRTEPLASHSGLRWVSNTSQRMQTTEAGITLQYSNFSHVKVNRLSGYSSFSWFTFYDSV